VKINLINCTEEELWKYIASELSKHEVDVILVGGAVVSIYSKGAYRSGDLDFVINDFSRTKLREVLAALGFHQKGRHFKNSDCKHLYLEFATFPASIGDDYSITPDELVHEGQIIKIFSPTDCVRDRLASFAFFNARECLDQAILVARNHSINFEKVKKWCIEEKIESHYEKFMVELKK
jgi:hypothetical protein